MCVLHKNEVVFAKSNKLFYKPHFSSFKLGGIFKGSSYFLS